jgi:DNA-binding ferritin-like protein (Dps family)
MKDSYLLYKDKLQGEYKNVFEQVEMYVNSENIDELTREDRLGSLLDMLLSAQEAGRPVEKVVGRNIEEFCKMFCSDMGIKNKIWHALDILKTIAIIELICAVLDLFAADWSKTDFWSMISTANASGYIFGFVACAIIGYFTNFVVRSFMFKSKKLNMNLLKCIVYFMTGVSFAAAFVLLSSDKLNFFTCPLWAFMLVCAIYLVVYFIFSRKRSRDKKQPKIKFFDAVSAQSRVDYDSIMQKRYNALNKRNIKKGKNALSMREFLDKEEKDCDRSDKMGWLFYIAPIILIVASLIDRDFDSTFDMLIFTAVMLAVEYAIMHFFFKITKQATDEKRAWISAKRAELDDQ